MATLNAIPVLSYADLYSSFLEVPSGYTVGTLAFGSSGKAFRLVLNGAVLLIVGNVLQSSILDTAFDALAVPTARTIRSARTGRLSRRMKSASRHSRRICSFFKTSSNAITSIW